MPLFAANPFEQDVGECWFRGPRRCLSRWKWAVATPGTGKPKPGESRGAAPLPRRRQGLCARSLAAWRVLPAHPKLGTPKEGHSPRQAQEWGRAWDWLDTGLINHLGSWRHKLLAPSRLSSLELVKHPSPFWEMMQK